VRVLRVAVQQLGQHLDLRRQLGDLLGQRRELPVAVGELRVTLSERRLEHPNALP
jgi:hypothetical protein